MTEATQERFTAEGDNAQACKIKVISARVEIEKFKSQAVRNKPVVMFSDERNALTYKMVEQMGQMNIAMIQAFTQKGDGLETCDDIIVSMVRSDAAKVAGLNNNGATAIKWIAGLVGLGLLSDGLNDLSGAGESRTQNNYNSRVVSDSGNGSIGSTFSSSGEGLGTGNTFGGHDVVGGFFPRSQADLVSGGGAQSNSGELTNRGISVSPIPVEVPVEAAPK